MVRVFIAVSGEEEFRVADIAAPATELGGFVMAQGYPERVVGQLLQTLWVDLRRGGQRGAGTQRQPGKAFEHRWQLNSKKNQALWVPLTVGAGLPAMASKTLYLSSKHA